MAAVVVDPKKIREFATADAFHAWLAEHHDEETEVWIKIHKKASGLPSIDWQQAVDVCLSWGWIDGIRKSFDERSFLQRYTPRGKKSIWSQINVANVERLIAEGRMTAHGLAHVEAAKADGRWARAYAPVRAKAIPDDLLRAIDASPRARATFDQLNGANRFALAFRVGNMKTEAGRAAKIEAFVKMLARGESLIPMKTPKTAKTVKTAKTAKTAKNAKNAKTAKTAKKKVTRESAAPRREKVGAAGARETKRARAEARHRRRHGRRVCATFVDMQSTSLILAFCGGLALVACGDDTAATTGGGSGGSGGASTTTGSTASGSVTSSASGSTSTTSTSSSSAEGGGGAGTGGAGTGGEGTGGAGTGGAGTGGAGTGGAGTGGAGTGGAGTGGEGTGGGLNVCPDFIVGDQSENVCDDPGALALDEADTTPCADLDVSWPARIYEVLVEEGDCVSMLGDNAGSLGADIFGSIVDPDGNNVLLDDEVECTVPVPGDFGCPSGAITMASAGVVHIIIGAYADPEVCPDGTDTDYQLAVSINGADVVLDPPVCTGDLFEIVP